jgi:type IV pilus assembly protein PilM
MDVLLAAVKKDKILNYTNVLSLAGKIPEVVDIDAFALQNCYEYNYEPSPSSTVALLNLGASVMNINIVRGNTPLFTRDVSVGGNQYTDSLQKELDLSFDDAESLKLGHKVGTVSEDAKLPILKQVTEIIVLEIQKTFDFFRATAAGQHIEKIYLAGGSSTVPGLMEALRQEFSMPVEILNPFQRIRAHFDGDDSEAAKNAGQLAVAVGLALRSFESL